MLQSPFVSVVTFYVDVRTLVAGEGPDTGVSVFDQVHGCVVGSVGVIVGDGGAGDVMEDTVELHQFDVPAH